MGSSATLPGGMDRTAEILEITAAALRSLRIHLYGSPPESITKSIDNSTLFSRLNKTRKFLYLYIFI